MNPEYYEVVRKLSEKGIQVVICSGRQKASIEKLFEPVKESFVHNFRRRKPNISKRRVHIFTDFAKRSLSADYRRCKKN